MKKAILMATLIAATLTVNAQVSISTEVGANLKNMIPMVGLSASVNIFNPATIEGGFLQHISSKVSAGNVAYVRAGFELKLGEYWKLNPAMGYQWTTRSADKKELNTSGEMYSITLVKQMENFENGQMFMTGNFGADLSAVTIGLRFTFGKERDGCY